jgi:hypothetical protein
MQIGIRRYLLHQHHSVPHLCGVFEPAGFLAGDQRVPRSHPANYGACDFALSYNVLAEHGLLI